jgi:hypothetical protein
MLRKMGENEEEKRLRSGQRLELYGKGKDGTMGWDGRVCKQARGGESF